MDTINYIVIVFFLAFLPPVLWLLFWLKEDDHPEPNKELVIVFLAGMGGVLAAIILENGFYYLNISSHKFFGYGAAAVQLINVLGFAFIEEITKTASAFFTAFRSKYFDEPVDAIIYLIVAALGFAALENVLFIGESLKGGVPQSVAVSAFRFINALLLHVSATAIIGAGFAFSFFHKKRRLREFALGIVLATLLHALYNFLIIKSAGGETASQIWATSLVVLGAFAALILFEKAKRVTI